MKHSRYIFCDLAVPLQESNTPLEDGVVYVTHDYYRADLKCPCGCSEVITLNLLPDTRPLWKISGNSISPSVNRTIGCKSHFTITGGIVYNNG